MEESTVAKKTTRTRKIVSTQSDPIIQEVQSQTTVMQNFDELVAKLLQSKQEFDNLQKENAQVKQDWIREQKAHEVEVAQQKSQEEMERKREHETYDYSSTLARKRAEDEFQDKKLAWEKDLAQRKEELEVQKRELEDLRKQVAGFESQNDQTVRDAQEQIKKELISQFEQEKKLREQEVKSEKEILDLKISNLEGENSRLIKEIEILKRSLDEAARQVKEIAVKVIESGNNQQKAQSAPEA